MQHGFLPRRSTVTNLLSAEEKVIRWFDKGDTVDIVYLDFAQSFDSVNYRLLLTKFKCYGVAPSFINWIESYLRRSSFQVSANRSLSQVAEAASGVPHGSALSHTLFVIYDNDLTDNLSKDHLLYANDVELIAPRKQADALQSSFVASSKWFTLPKVSTSPLEILPILLHTPYQPAPHPTHSPFRRSALSVIQNFS